MWLAALAWAGCGEEARPVQAPAQMVPQAASPAEAADSASVAVPYPGTYRLRDPESIPPRLRLDPLTLSPDQTYSAMVDGQPVSGRYRIVAPTGATEPTLFLYTSDVNPLSVDFQNLLHFDCKVKPGGFELDGGGETLVYERVAS
jgi:hypothetical protein